MKVITLANQKGGCGKTTTAQILAIGLANRGYKVLSIDCDAQCNLTSVLGIVPEQQQNTMYELLKNESALNNCVVSVRENLDLIPGNLLLNGADREFNKVSAPYMLDKILSNTKKYDFCVIDTAPSFGIMTINALMATDLLIIPMTPDYFTIQGLAQLKENIEEIQSIQQGKKLKVSGLLLTRCDRTGMTAVMKDSIASAAKSMSSSVFNATIRQGVAIRESQLLQSDIFTESPKSNVTAEYNAFIDELIEREKL